MRESRPRLRRHGERAGTCPDELSIDKGARIQAIPTSSGRVFTNLTRTAAAVSEVPPYASCMELEVRPASEVERFVAFAGANGCQCHVLRGHRPDRDPPPLSGHRLTFDVPLARDPTEARRIALDVIASFSAENTRADVRVTRYD